MADTFARVELHERWAGDKPDYELLHGKMEEAGFVRYMYEGLKRVRLPTGMYRSSAKDGILLLKAKLVFAAGKTGHRNEGMVWRGEEMTTWGLAVVHTIGMPLAPPPLVAKLNQVGVTPPPRRSALLSSAPSTDRDWENLFGLK
jgi:hypothetical protein